jgi:hypothetical protein
MLRLTMKIGVPVCALLLATSALAAPVAYNFDFVTFYAFSSPSDLLGGGLPTPDTAFARVVNHGLSTLNGVFSTTAVSQFAGDFSFSSPISLAPGASASIAIGPESSNVGGFNGPFGSPQPGVLLSFVGTADIGPDSTAISVSANDSNIHSGVFRTNRFGVNLDNYVLQGGDPLGRDAGDVFETAQAPGVKTFSSGPEPGTLTLLSAASAMLLLRRRAKR